MAQDLVAKLRIENKEAKQSITELKQTVKNLKAELKQVGQQARATANQGNSMGQFGRVLKQTGAEGLNLTSALGGMKKMLGWVGVAFGAAEAAGNVFNRMQKESQTVGDAVARVQHQAGEAVNYFANCMARADFSNFLSGLQDVIDKAGEAADALDDLASRQLIFGFTNQQLSNEYEQQLLISKDLTRTEQERAAALQRARDISAQMSDNARDMASHYESTAIKTLTAELSKQGKNLGTIDRKFIDTYFNYSNFNQRQSKKEEYDDYTRRANELDAQAQRSKQGRISALKRKHAYDAGWSPSASDYAYNSNENDLRQQAAALRRERDSDRTRVISWATSEIDDSQESVLAEALQFLSQQSSLDLDAARRDFQMNRSDHRLHSGGGHGGRGGRGGSGGGKKTDPVYNANAVTLQQMEDNVTVLTKKLKGLDPNTEEFRQVSAELQTWNGAIQTINDNLKMGNAKSLTGMNNRLSAAQTKLDGLVSGTDEFNAAWDDVQKLTKQIADENLARLQRSLVENAQTDEDINNNIQIYQQLQSRVIRGSQEWLRYQKLITTEQAKQRDYATGSTSDLQRQIQEIDQQLSSGKTSAGSALTPEVRAKLIVDKYNLKKQMDELSDESGASIKLRTTDYATDSKRASYNNAQSNISSIQDDYSMGLINADQAKAQIAEVNAQLQAMGMKPIMVHIETDAEKVFGDVADIVGSMGDAFSSMGQLFDDEAFDVAGIVAQAIAQLMLGYATASAQAGSLSPFGWIAFSVAGLAQVLAAAASIKNATSHANGGIVGGSSFAGDNVYARLNSGEMVLNNRQQKNLFDALDSGVAGGGGGQVTFRIHGRDLVGTLSNYSNIKAKTGGKRVSFA